MSGQGIGQILVYAGALIVLGYPLGMYMARVYTNAGFATGGWLRWLGATERGFYRLIGTNAPQGAGLEGLREDDDRLHDPLLRAPLCASSACRRTFS